MLPDAVRYTGFAGFSVPGIEVYRHDCEGAPCEPCEVDEGETCRPHWVNRQDHGYLTRVNIARAQHPGVAYGCPDEGLECLTPDLRTTVYGVEDDEFTSSFAGSVMQRRVRVEQVRQRARERVAQQQQAVDQVRRTIAGARQRRKWGSHQNHNGVVGKPVGIRYIPVSGGEHDIVGASTEGDFDCTIVAPGHMRCDFYEK